MSPELILQLHVHSKRSHDSCVSIEDYVNYLEDVLLENEYAVLGVVDHNTIPIRNEEAFELSTEKVVVIPGIQWKLHKKLGESLKKLCTRREIVTLGDHDKLREYINKKTSYSIKNDEILDNFREDEFLDYISGNREIIFIVPHPKHFVVDYYGKKEIKELKQKIDERNISIPFFVEEKTGYDPFPRLLYSYTNRYLTLGGSDAHEIYSFLGTNSLFSVDTRISCDKEIPDLLQEAKKTEDITIYKQTVKNIFGILEERNDEITIEKKYFNSIVHFMGSVPRWFKRRINNFPHNVFK